jgi:hypothetical protein
MLESSTGAGDDRAAIVINSLARVHLSRGRYAEAEQLCNKALAVLESVFDEHHPSVADVLETLIKLHRTTGDETKAAPLQQRVEQIRMRERVAYVPTSATVQ